MINTNKGAIPTGWKGGFMESDPKFAYPDPDLSSLPMLKNMCNIDKLKRQQAVIWPQFSWQTILGDESSRCYQMFSQDISRIGYTDCGRVYSIICPQQGTYSPTLGALNIEVTVTGNRGWVDEPSKTLAADMTVEGKIWFSHSAHESTLVQMLWALFADNGLPFPSNKDNSIKVNLLNADNPLQESLPVRSGVSDKFKIPAFARHDADAFSVSNVQVKIGKIRKVGNEVVDDFNQLVMEAFNLASGNLLTPGNILSWNVWATQPQLVDQDEWHDHAERWRKSIDTGHGSPGGPGVPPKYYDGTPFSAAESAVEAEIAKIIAFLKKHLLKL